MTVHFSQLKGSTARYLWPKHGAVNPCTTVTVWSPTSDPTLSSTVFGFSLPRPPPYDLLAACDMADESCPTSPNFCAFNHNKVQHSNPTLGYCFSLSSQIFGLSVYNIDHSSRTFNWHDIGCINRFNILIYYLGSSSNSHFFRWQLWHHFLFDVGVWVWLCLFFLSTFMTKLLFF